MFIRLGGPPLNSDFPQLVIPAALGTGDNRPKGQSGIFRGEVFARPFDADKGDADPDHHNPALGRVKSCKCARVGTHRRIGFGRLTFTCRGRTRAQSAALPGAKAFERPAEDSGKIDSVTGTLTAKQTAGGGAIDFLSRGIDLNARIVIGLSTTARVDQDARMRVGRKVEAAQAGPRRRRQFRLDRSPVDRLQAHRVIAGLGPFPIVREPRLQLPNRVERFAEVDATGEVATGSVVGRNGKSP